MKKVHIVAAVAGVVILLAIVAVWAVANPNRYRQTIQARLEKQLGRSVSLGQMSLGLVPLGFHVTNPVIAEDPLFSRERPFVKAEDLRIRIGILPLLKGEIRIDSVELRRPAIELIATKEGKWNFSTLGSTDENQPGAPPAASETPVELSVRRLLITDGQIGITDLRQSSSRTGYDHIDLTVLDYSSKTPFYIDLAAHVEGQAAQELRLKGSAGPLAANRMAETPFRGTLSVKQVQLAPLLPQAKGILSGESEIASQSGNLTSNGKLKLEEAKFNNVDIGYPIAFDYKLTARTGDGFVSIQSATLQLGPTPLSVSGSINTASTPPEIDLKLKSGNASISEVARLASAFGVAFAPGASVAGKVSADVRAKGTTTKPALTGTIAGRDLEISGQGVAQPVHVNAIDLALSPSAIQSNEFIATTGKTKVSGQFSLLQYNSSTPSIDLGLRSAGATLPEIQAIAKAYGMTGLDQLHGAGTLNFDLRAKGPMQSLSTSDAARALNGTINLDFSPLKLAGFDAVHELGKLGGFASNLTAYDSTDIVKLIGQIFVKDGVAETNDLRAQLSSGKMTAVGTADLATETLNLKLAAVFAKDFADKVGATRTGGVVNAAFTNNAGELVLPAIVTGTFKNPKFSPDLKAVVELQKQKIVPALIGEKASGLKGLLDAIKGKK
jgi:AsmA protein